MSSDSPVPFLGLQWSVDASDAQQKQQRYQPQPIQPAADEEVAALPAPVIPHQTARAQSPEAVLTPVSAEVLHPVSRPTQFPTASGDETDPFQAIGRRMAAF